MSSTQSRNICVPAHIPPDRVLDFDYTQIPGLTEDFFRAYQVLQAPGVPDLVWTPRNEGHWIATRAQVIKDVLGDYKRFSSRLVLLPKSVAEQAKFIPMTLDPPLHRPFRNLLNGALAPQIVDSRAAAIRKVASDLVTALRGRGQCDFVKEFAHPFPMAIFMTMLDLPPAQAPALKRLVDEVARPTTMTLEEVSAAFAAYLDPVIEQRIGGNGSDLISIIANGTIGDRPINRDEIFQTCFLVMGAGLDTVLNSLAFLMHFLAQSPSHRRALVEDPHLIPSAADEFLRRFGVILTAREVTHDVHFHGVELKRGEVIALPTWLGGIDERVNADPLSVDFHRAQRVDTTFGGGIHSCPGKYLARTELRIALEEWLSRIPEFDIAPAAEVRFSGGLGAAVDSLHLVWTRPREH